MPGSVSRPCPLCATPAAAPWRTAVGGAHFCRCAACSVVFLEHFPTSDERRNLYGETYFRSSADAACGYADYAAQEDDLTATARHYLQQLLPLLPRRRQLIDFGCGHGFLLTAARPLFDAILGIDISRAAAATLASRELPHLVADICTVAAGTLPSADLVTMFDFLEHCPDPHAVCDLAARTVTPGGLVAILTPDTDSWLCRLSGNRWVSLKAPEHLMLYNRVALTRLLSTHGLIPVVWAAGWQRASLAFVIERCLRLLPGTAFWTRRAGRLAPGLSGWFPNGNLFVIARRRDSNCLSRMDNANVPA